jgi:hypothetical protein
MSLGIGYLLSEYCHLRLAFQVLSFATLLHVTRSDRGAIADLLLLGLLFEN